MKTTFNLKTLEAVAAVIPAWTRATYFTTPEIESRLKSDPAIEALPLSASFFGIPINVKPGQKMPCYMISDPEISRQYLTGQITEADLMQMLTRENQTVIAAIE